jgi:hypothetical protein
VRHHQAAEPWAALPRRAALPSQGCKPI